MSEKITERVVGTAIEESAATLAKPETQRQLHQILASPEMTSAIHEVSGAVVRGMMDAMTSPQYTSVFTGTGEKIGRSLAQDIAPGMATIARQTVEASLAATLSEENQKKMERVVHGMVGAAIASTAEGLEYQLGPALARTMEKDMIPALARGAMQETSQQALAMTTQQLAQHLIRGSSGEIDRVADNRDGEDGFLGLLGGRMAVGYAVSVFVAFAFGTLLVVLSVMLARSTQRRRKLEEESRKREEAFLALIDGLTGKGASITSTPNIEDWVRSHVQGSPA